MKRILVLCVLICFAIICACQKQDPEAEAQLAQRKAELDAREKALDEKEKALGEREKAIAISGAIPSQLQSPRSTVDPEQVKAERERRIQQLPPELQALIRNRSLLDTRTAEKNTATVDPEQAKAERERRIQQLPAELQALIRDRSLLDPRTGENTTSTEDRAAQLQRRLEEARKKMSAMASPNAEDSDTQPSSPSPSPTPE
jgi:chromosome segregation ATPase